MDDDDDVSIKLITSETTPKRKSLFSDIERKVTKRRIINNDAFIHDEINIYLNDKDSDSNRFILIDQSINYRAMN